MKDSTLNNLNSKKTQDHYVINNLDLEASKKNYEKLGFHVRPIAEHVKIGSRNCVIHFPNTYYELIDVAKSDNELVAIYKEFLKIGEGIASFAINSLDLEKSIRWAKDNSLDPEPILNATRQITRPDGSQDFTNSSSFYIWQTRNPLVSVFFSEHKKPDTIFIPEYEQHPNGVIDVTKIVFMSQAPELDQHYFETVFQVKFTGSTVQGFSITGPRSEVCEVRTYEAAIAEYGPYMGVQDPTPFKGKGIAVHFSVKELSETKRYLSEQGIEFDDRESKLIVSAKDTHGYAMVFEPVSEK